MSTIKIGCEAYIARDGKLLGKRGNITGKGTLALPGGHLEFMERADAGVLRELKEETGISVTSSDVSLMAVTDDLRPERNEHYVHFTFKVDIGDQEPRVLEPDACEEWAWFELDNLPPIFSFQAKEFDTIASHHIYN